MVTENGKRRVEAALSYNVNVYIFIFNSSKEGHLSAKAGFKGHSTVAK